MKKITAFVVLAALILTTLTALAGTPSFSDIEGHWAKDAILEAASRGLFSGNPDGTFAPERVINRAELAVVVTKTLDLPPDAGAGANLSFKDAWQIPAWARDAVATLVQKEIMQGRNDGTFGPQAPVTREEAAVVLSRALGLAQEAQAFTGKPGFTDDNLISQWALGFVALAREKGLFTGNPQGQFLPQQSLKRGEAAQVMLKFLELAENPVQGWTEENSSGLTAITTSNLNLRSNPGTESAKITTIPQGTQIPVHSIANYNGETWLQVTFQGQRGYVSAAYAELKTTSPPGEAETPAKEADDLLVATTTANLNVRTSPGINSPRVGLLPQGTKVTVEEVVEHQGETWLRISYQGQTAYIAGEYTDLTTMPLAPPEKDPGQGGKTPETGVPPAPEEPGSEEENPGGQAGSGPTTPPSLPAGDPEYRSIDSGNIRGLRLVVPGGKVTVATLTDNLNVRAAPGTDSPRLGGLPAGTKIPVEDIVTGSEGQWLKISYQGRTAYLAAWYATLNQESQDVPAPGVNEITLSRVNDSLYTLTVKGTNPLGGKLRTESGRIILEITGLDIPATKRSVAPGPFTTLGCTGDTIYLEHKLQQVEARLRATGDGSLQVLLGINPDDPNLGQSVGWEPKGLLKGKVIMLDAGHGGSDPGALGSTYGTREKDVVLPITLKTAALLEAQGATVILTRQQDTSISLEARVNLSNSRQPHIFVSIHADYNYNPAISGSTVYYSSANPRSSESYRLGTLIMDSLEENVGLRRVGVRDSRYYVLRNNTVPAVLVETAFLSYQPEEALLRQDHFQQQVAEAIARGIIRYFQ
ncbi:MAG: N-acetylmuramoyl-L-alanine amidase [bacterium]